MPTITTNDGTELYFKDWGEGPVVVLCHGWPLNADSWEAQALFLATNGFRVPGRRRTPAGTGTARS
jgi:non-heme chloroperoxidase